MEASEAWCSDRGIRVLEVVTQGANEGACALYRAAGFEGTYDAWARTAAEVLLHALDPTPGSNGTA